MEKDMYETWKSYCKTSKITRILRGHIINSPAQTTRLMYNAIKSS